MDTCSHRAAAKSIDGYAKTALETLVHNQGTISGIISVP
jgi:hypothetical protein